MKILNSYIAGSLAVTAALAVGVLTFVMTAGHIIRLFDLLSRGVPPAVLGRFLVLRLPDMLRFTLPMALLCATVLVFSQLSADNEFSAMKACGISLWQVIAPGLILSVLLSGVCFWLSTTVAPRCRYAADQLLWEQAAAGSMALLESHDAFIELEGLNVRVERRDGDALYGIHILVQDEQLRLRQTITAREGHIRRDGERGVLELVLQDATFGSVNLEGEGAAEDREEGPGRFATRQITLPLSLGKDSQTRRLVRKSKHMDLPMLFGRIALDSESGVPVTPLLVELHTRMSMALSPIAFLLLGIPFAIRSRRSETSVGLLLSLLLALGFYAFILLTRSLRSEGAFRPELLVWLPNVLYQAGGLRAIAVISRH
ncbi:MAG: LptF/LptG family permease [Lentisphaeria bacterium]|nr:LptF/LptG family permease [Lentisphaeria bacterium]